jgi:hypothetical protein
MNQVNKHLNGAFSLKDDIDCMAKTLIDLTNLQSSMEKKLVISK